MITERAFQEQVMALARLCGWRFTHFRTSIMQSGAWATAVDGDPGWPDLFLVKGRKALAWELKVKGKATPEQERWLGSLRATGIEARVVRPKDWEYIEEALKS